MDQNERRRGRSRSRSRSRERDRHFNRERGRGRGEFTGRSSERPQGYDELHGARRDGGGGSIERYDSGTWNRDRERDYGGDRERGKGKGRERERRVMSEPSNTVIIKGLPSHTTEPSLYAVLANFSPQNIRLICERGSGECKGFAFVEFYSIEYAEYFTNAFSGSMGDINAPQLIVENRAVTIDFALPRSEDNSRHGPKSSTDGTRRGDVIKSDWLCETCGCQNFARREKCYRCSSFKTQNAVNVTANLTADPYADISIVGSTPSSTLAVRGLPLYFTEDQVSEMFRQYAVVKSVHVVRDFNTNLSRGIAFVEFHSIEHATHTMHCFSGNQTSNDIKVNYAKDSFVQGLPALQQQYQTLPQYAQPNMAPPSAGGSAAPSSHLNSKAFAQVALQAAQWAAGATTAVNDIPQANSVYSQPPSSRSGAPSYFETHGAAYIFQPKSGIFYDNLTKFYYCPKSRLYYNEVDGRYLYASSSDSSGGKKVVASSEGIDFVEFIPPVPSADKPNEAEEKKDVDSKETSIPAVRKPVVMSLGGLGSKKSNSLKNEKAKSSQIVNAPVSVTSVLPSAAKQISKDIAKWSEVKNSFGIDDEEDDSANANVPTARKGKPASTAPQQGEQDDDNAPGKVATTSKKSATSAIVCTLCRRQFNSKEQLLRHEKESKLHASNLAKLSKASSDQSHVDSDVKSSAKTAPVYRDRASERRAIYGQPGPDDAPLVAPSTDWICSQCKCDNFAKRLSCYRCSASVSTAYGGPAESQSSSHRPVETSHQGNAAVARNADLSEDKDNPGNQLLRRLGWKDGEGLGRDGSGDTVSVASKLEQKNPSSGMGAPHEGTYSGEGSDYKKNILLAAKARYDRLGKD